MSLPTPVEPTFVDRHIGPSDADQSAMLQFLGYDSLDSLMDAAVPHRIRNAEAMNLPPALSEEEAAAKLRSLADAQRHAQREARQEHAAAQLCQRLRGEATYRWTDSNDLVCLDKRGRNAVVVASGDSL